ncbi:MAG: MBOAT family protein [Lachnospiraceae bacterium]|nr:MBOAT family protein [Lachnospiraceae bacterium]
MVFSSLVFTFIFLPVVVALYFIAKDKYRNYILLAASLLFYAYGEPRFVLVMILSIAVNYFIALSIDRQNISGSKNRSRVLLITDIVLNIGLLFVFKYLNYTVLCINRLFKTELNDPEIALPIGISFFTFQALSYCIDVYRGTVRAQKNPLYTALYISFFPQLIAGPIVRYSTIADQITGRSLNIDDFAEGVRRFFLGFAKKVILANNLSSVASQIFGSDYSNANPYMLWLGSICFSLQIFYDFSGYSDMAIGLGRMFGFRFHENFNYPYISRSITEFWRRWHISLGQWFRDYVYIPLGGSRVPVPRNILNLFIVWALTGIWHGANVTFLIWGLLYFLLLSIEKFVIRPEKHGNIIFTTLWRICSLFFINIGWVIFNSAGLPDAFGFIKGMFGGYGTGISFFADSSLKRLLREYGAFIILGLIFSAPVMKYLKQKLESKSIGKMTVSVISPIAYGFIFIWAVSYLILGSHNPFIYFNF